MKTKILMLALATASFAIHLASGEVNYPSCSGADCTPTCTTPACQPPPVPCPAAGAPWCN